MTDTCSSCFYGRTNQGYLACHKGQPTNQPSVAPTRIQAVWPEVNPSGWCGMWSDVDPTIYAGSTQGPPGPAGITGLQSSTLTTDASGNATFTFSPAYVSTPVASISIQSGTGLIATLVAISNSALTINVVNAAGVAQAGVSVGVFTVGV